MERNYTESTYYQLRLTARYVEKFTQQLFEKISSKITFDEFLVLEILKAEGVMCQRDMAKILLKDRANTGKILNSLLQKGYVVIKIEEKNKRIVKNIHLTQNGIDYVSMLKTKMEPLIEKVSSIVSAEDQMILTLMLQKCQKEIEKILELQI